MRQELLLEGSDRIELHLMEDGWPLAPSSCSISIIHNGDVLEEGTAEVTPGICSYVPGEAVVGELRKDVLAVFAYVLEGPQAKRTVVFDVVRSKLYPVITDRDLVAECPALASAGGYFTSIIDTATPGSFTDNKLIGSSVHWIGAVALFHESGGSAVVTGFNASTGTITFDAMPEAPAGSYSLQKGFSSEIARAWEDTMNYIYQVGGYRPALVMDTEDLRAPHLYRALEKACFSLAVNEDDIWFQRYRVYEGKAESTIKGLRLTYDQDEDNVPDSEALLDRGFSR